MAEIGIKCDSYMYWGMHTRCNFECEYCFREYGDRNSRFDNAIYGKYTAEHICQRFDETGMIWHIYMTGGEPLLYPNFVELAKTLTQRHYMSFSTNLSTPNAYILADTIDPQRVTSVDVSLHIQEREKIADGINELLQKFLYFQKQGFDVRLLYVAYPPLLGRIKEDFKKLKGEGVKKIQVKVFQGKYKERRYPRNYSDEERALMCELGLNKYEAVILTSRISFLGKKCIAGHRAFVMDMFGRVTRCNSLKNEYGNFFEGTFVPGTSPRRCTARKCACAYQGLKFTDGRASMLPPHIIARPAKLLLSVGDFFRRRL